MRIVVMSPTRAGSLGVSLARALAAEGHSAVVAGRPSLLVGRRILIVSEHLGAEGLVAAGVARGAVERVARMRPDAVVVIKGRFLTARMVERLRSRVGVPVVNYYPDDPFSRDHGGEGVVEALTSYDLVCTWASSLEPKLRDAGVSRTMVLPFSYDPDEYPPRPAGHRYLHDAAFIGQWQPAREEFLASIADLRLVISGGGWARETRGKPLSRHVISGHHFARAAAEVYWSSKVGVNILQAQNVEASGHNMRSWELPATRTATVATRTLCHERMYGDDGAVLVSTPDEFSTAVRELLADEERRERVAAAGAEAVEGGTYRARARALAAAIADLRTAARPAGRLG